MEEKHKKKKTILGGWVLLIIVILAGGYQLYKIGDLFLSTHGRGTHCSQAFDCEPGPDGFQTCHQCEDEDCTKVTEVLCSANTGTTKKSSN